MRFCLQAGPYSFWPRSLRAAWQGSTPLPASFGFLPPCESTRACAGRLVRGNRPLWPGALRHLPLVRLSDGFCSRMLSSLRTLLPWWTFPVHQGGPFWFCLQDNLPRSVSSTHLTLWRPCALFGNLFTVRRVFGCFLFGHAFLAFSRLETLLEGNSGVWAPAQAPRAAVC